MPKFVIERSLPGAGKATQQRLKEIAQVPIDRVSAVRNLIDPTTAE